MNYRDRLFVGTSVGRLIRRSVIIAQRGRELNLPFEVLVSSCLVDVKGLGKFKSFVPDHMIMKRDMVRDRSIWKMNDFGRRTISGDRTRISNPPPPKKNEAYALITISDNSPPHLVTLKVIYMAPFFRRQIIMIIICLRFLLTSHYLYNMPRAYILYNVRQ